MFFSNRSGVFHDVFCGTGGVADGCQQLGLVSLKFDICLHPKLDVLSSAFVKHFANAATNGQVAAVCLATPCSSFSLANSRSGRAIRSKEHPLGKPNLTEAELARVRLGNNFAYATAKIARICIRNRIPCVIENPCSSYLLCCPDFQQLLDLGKRVDLHQCAFGAKWRKYTSFSFLHFPG